MDPAHIAPSRTDANSNGHFPPPNGQAPTGTPRGFNLQSYAMNNMLSMPGFPLPGAFPPGLFNAAAMQPAAETAEAARTGAEEPRAETTTTTAAAPTIDARTPAGAPMAGPLAA